jgi:hypothetical protein
LSPSAQQEWQRLRFTARHLAISSDRDGCDSLTTNACGWLPKAEHPRQRVLREIGTIVSPDILLE